MEATRSNLMATHFRSNRLHCGQPGECEPGHRGPQIQCPAMAPMRSTRILLPPWLAHPACVLLAMLLFSSSSALGAEEGDFAFEPAAVGARVIRPSLRRSPALAPVEALSPQPRSLGRVEQNQRVNSQPNPSSIPCVASPPSSPVELPSPPTRCIAPPRRCITAGPTTRADEPRPTGAWGSVTCV
jgi:hypothetical protein